MNFLRWFFIFSFISVFSIVAVDGGPHMDPNGGASADAGILDPNGGASADAGILDPNGGNNDNVCRGDYTACIDPNG